LGNKGIPVNLGEFINLKLNMGGTLTNPVLKTDLKQAGGTLVQDLKQQATDFAKAKIDSAKTSVKNAVKDTVAVIKKQVIQSAAEELKRQLAGQKDSSKAAGTQDSRKKVEESAKGLLDNLNPFKKKKTIDSVKH
jgi:ABC-type phosphate transport system auxiliary subunit